MMRYLRFLIPVVVILALGAGGYYFFVKKSASPAVTAKPTPPPEKVNTIPVEERPFATLTPSLNGRNVTLVVYDLKKPASKGEYELEYQTNNLLQGAFGRVNVSKLPDTQDILLGSCSAGGKCTYHENVTGGSLLLRLQDPEKYVLKNEWSYLINTDKKTQVVSRDSKFTAEGAGFAATPFAIVLQVPGLPKNPEQKVISLGYSVGVAKPVKGAVTVTIRLSEDAATASVLGWDGKAWKTLKATVADKTATAKSPELYSAYVAVSAE